MVKVVMALAFMVFMGSGLCTGAMVINALMANEYQRDALLLPLVFGLPTILISSCVWYTLRKKRRPPP